jgi:hypothetical protein
MLQAGSGLMNGHLDTNFASLSADCTHFSWTYVSPVAQGINDSTNPV